MPEPEPRPVVATEWFIRAPMGWEVSGSWPTREEAAAVAEAMFPPEAFRQRPRLGWRYVTPTFWEEKPRRRKSRRAATGTVSETRLASVTDIAAALARVEIEKQAAADYTPWRIRQPWLRSSPHTEPRKERQPDTCISFVGELRSASGWARQYDREGREVIYGVAPALFAREQHFPMPVLIDHDLTAVVGRIEHIEVAPGGALACVGRVWHSGILDGGDWYLSGRWHRGDAGLLLQEVSVVRDPAVVGVRPLRWVEYDLQTGGGGAPHGLPLAWRTVWDHAGEQMAARRWRKDPDRLVIAGLPEAVNRATPQSLEMPPRHDRADAERAAEDHGLDGYSWQDPDGLRRHVHYGGKVTAFGASS